MPTWTQANRPIAVTSPLGDDVLLLRSLVYSERLGRPFELHLSVASENHAIDADKILGQNVSVRINRAGDDPRFLNGYVASFEQTRAMGGGLAGYEVVVVPWIHFLGQTCNCRAWQDVAAMEVVRKVLRQWQLGEFKERLENPGKPRENVVQYRESDLAFISRLCEREGVTWYARHSNGSHCLHFVDGASGFEAMAKDAKLRFLPGTESLSERNALLEWTSSASVLTGHVSLTDYDFEEPQTSLLSTSKKEGKHQYGDFEAFDHPGGYFKPAEGDHWARVRLEEIRARAAEFVGVTVSRSIEVGGRFKIDGHPRKDLNAEYMVTSVSMTVDAGDFDRAGASGGFSHLCRFTAIRSDVPFRPRRLTHVPVIAGPQSAVVVGPAGQEIHTDKHGRVKVKFHWDRYAKGDETSSCWLRVCQPWAGRKWGGFFLPRIGHEVLVEFLEGDPDRPVITGSLYNGDNPPPYPLPAQQTISTIKSNSSPKGPGFNELRFDDKKGNEQVFVRAQKAYDLRVLGTAKETIYGNREVRVGWEKGDESGGSLNQLVRLDENTRTKGGRFELVEKKLNMTVKADVVEDFQANQTTLVKETYTLNSAKGIVETKDLLSLKSGAVKMQGTQSLDIKTASLKIAGDNSFDAKGATVNIQGAQTVNIKGGMQVNIEGGMGVSLKCGGNAVVLDPSGVAIQGTMVRINMGAAGSPAAAAAAAASADAATAPAIDEPFDPLIAIDAPHGDPSRTKAGGRAAPRGRSSRQLTPQHAPPPPPPPPDPKMPPPPPPPASGKPCGIKALELTCGHGKRSPGPSGILQVVATPDSSKKKEKKIRGIPMVFDVRTGGQDSCKAKVVIVDEDAARRKQIAVRETASPPPESAWTNGGEQTVKVKPPEGDDIWTLNNPPRMYFIHGRGCDEVSQLVIIESYPSRQTSLKIEHAFFETWSTGVTAGWEKWASGVLKAVGVSLKPKITPPTGVLEGAWGWAEDKDWQAFFEVAVRAGLDPVIGVGIELKVSFGTLLLNGLGCPPFISGIVADYVADLYLSVGAGAKASLTGGPKARFYPSGESRIVGDLALTGEGSVYLKVTAKAGSEEMLGASVSAGGETKVVAEAKGEFDRTGVYLTPGVTLKPLTVTVVVMLKAFSTTREKQLGEWTPWDDIELYKGERHRLFPGDQN
jgi:type VI secretion system secreted protein VgrG